MVSRMINETMKEIQERKRMLRRQILSARDEIPQEKREKMSAQICGNAISLSAFEKAERVLCFASFGSEIDTQILIDTSIRRGKKTFLPRVEGEDMYFYQIRGREDLTAGYKGIMEPNGKTERYVPGVCKEKEPVISRENTEKTGATEGSKDILFLPGVVFDRYGGRIGYGKGFYDRFLSGGYGGEVYALAFGMQVTDGQIEKADWDIPVRHLITENGVAEICFIS